MKKGHFLLLVCMIVGLVGCDHTTKHIAQEELRNQPDVTLISGVLDLTYAENRGVGFNVLRWIPYEIRHPLSIAVGLFVIPFLLVLWCFRRRDRWPFHAAFALLLGGALGNMLDRIFQGYVIDFIHVHYWPIFNMADIWLTIGSILLVLLIIREGRATTSTAENPAQ